MPPHRRHVHVRASSSCASCRFHEVRHAVRRGTQSIIAPISGLCTVSVYSRYGNEEDDVNSINDGGMDGTGRRRAGRRPEAVTVLYSTTLQCRAVTLRWGAHFDRWAPGRERGASRGTVQDVGARWGRDDADAHAPGDG